jgi:hypothetical protein
MYKNLIDENSNIFLRKPANTRYMVLVLKKDLFFVKNLENIPRDKNVYVSPLSVLKLGKNLFLGKFKFRIFFAPWKEFKFRL